MTKDYDGFRAGMLRAAEMARNEFKRAPEAAKGHDCVYMGGYEDACDHLSAVIAQAAVIDSVRAAGAQPDWQYHISLLLPVEVEDAALLKIYQVVEHETRALTNEVTRLREETLKGICVYCGHVERYESLEQKNGDEGNRMRIAHIQQCSARPELKLIAEVTRLREALDNAEAAMCAARPYVPRDLDIALWERIKAARAALQPKAEGEREK